MMRVASCGSTVAYSLRLSLAPSHTFPTAMSTLSPRVFFVFHHSVTPSLLPPSPCCAVPLAAILPIALLPPFPFSLRAPPRSLAFALPLAPSPSLFTSLTLPPLPLSSPTTPTPLSSPRLFASLATLVLAARTHSCFSRGSTTAWGIVHPSKVRYGNESWVEVKSPDGPRIKGVVKDVVACGDYVVWLPKYKCRRTIPTRWVLRLTKKGVCVSACCRVGVSMRVARELAAACGGMLHTVRVCVCLCVCVWVSVSVLVCVSVCVCGEHGRSRCHSVLVCGAVARDMFAAVAAEVREDGARARTPLRCQRTP